MGRERERRRQRNSPYALNMMIYIQFCGCRRRRQSGITVALSWKKLGVGNVKRTGKNRFLVLFQCPFLLFHVFFFHLSLSLFALCDQSGYFRAFFPILRLKRVLFSIKFVCYFFLFELSLCFLVRDTSFCCVFSLFPGQTSQLRWNVFNFPWFPM